jgi:hypothetical protein
MRLGFQLRLGAFWYKVAFLYLLICILSCLVTFFDNQAYGAELPKLSGKASDLGELRIGWPLGTPMTCLAIESELQRKIAVVSEKLHMYCNESNEIQEVNGYPSCPHNYCPFKSSLGNQKNNDDQFSLKLGRDQWSGDIILSISYIYVRIGSGEASGPICYSPSELVSELLHAEVESWTYSELAEFCSSR